MYYGDADNNLENFLLSNVSEMKRGFVDGQGVNLVLLFDRPPAGSNHWGAFDENFAGGRLYSVTHGRTLRLNGGEFFPEITESSGYVDVNMGDANTLKNFIRFCKANFPAQRYALILSNHGGGPKKKSSLSGSGGEPLYKELCEDATSKDALYTHEISSTLTSEESVDVWGIDACLMSSVEFAYQFRRDSTNSRFSAEILVASAPLIWSSGWDFRAILSRLKGDSVSSMSARDFGMNILREEKYSRWTMTQMSCLDLTKVSAVKEAVDDLAKELSPYQTLRETVWGSLASPKILHYFNNEDGSFDAGENKFPFFDLYALAEGIYNSALFNTNTPVKDAALALMKAVDNFIIDSFMNENPAAYSSYPFNPGRNGVHIFFPDEDLWISAQMWYTYQNNQITNTEGKIVGTTGLDWCEPSGNASGNWRELLADWYDH
ncbi:MAG: clostripain-related cysteine peptidase [Leptospirales bacterium]|nr:clostripain-related cysteine peptidase [Leptospirales bacterium]